MSRSGGASSPTGPSETPIPSRPSGWTFKVTGALPLPSWPKGNTCLGKPHIEGLIGLTLKQGLMLRNVTFHFPYCRQLCQVLGLKQHQDAGSSTLQSTSNQTINPFLVFIEATLFLFYFVPEYRFI